MAARPVTTRLGARSGVHPKCLNRYLLGMWTIGGPSRDESFDHTHVGETALIEPDREANRRDPRISKGLNVRSSFEDPRPVLSAFSAICALRGHASSKPKRRLVGLCRQPTGC